MVYRHGVSTRGIVEVVDIDAWTGFLGVAALAEATTARAAVSTRRSRMSLILGTDLHEAARADFPRAEGGRGRREPGSWAPRTRRGGTRRPRRARARAGCRPQ